MSGETLQAIDDAIAAKIEHIDRCERGCECSTEDEVNECIRFDDAIDEAIDQHVASALTALRQQVADLRAALIEAYDAVDAYAADTGVMLRVNRAVLDATQPQGVQG